MLLSLPTCGRSPEVTSMFCLVSSHSRHSIRSTEGSEYSLYRHPWRCVFTTFTAFAAGFCYWCVGVIFPLTKVWFCPSFFFLPSSSLRLHYPCPCSMSLYYNLCHFYHSQWLHLLLPPGILLSFNFDTCLHYLPERSSRGLKRTAGNGTYSFPEGVTIGWCKFYRGENC